MKSGICVKCGSRDVYHSVASPRSSDRVTLKEGLVGRDASSVTRFLCGTCGYLEYYVTNDEDLGIIRESWNKVAVG
jgi:ribosomal protein S27AE